MKRIAIVLLVVLLLCAALSLTACGDKLKSGQVRITVGDKSFIAELADTKAAKQLEKALATESISIKMTAVNSQYIHGNVANREFPSSAEESGIMDAGDIMMQGNNELVLFYAVNTSNDRLTRIGKIREEDRTAFANAVNQAVSNSSSKSVTITISK